MRPLLWAVVCTAILASPLQGQAAGSDDNQVDALLNQNAVTWGNAAWLVGRAAGAFDETISPDEAAKKAVAAGWGSPDLTPASVLDAAGFSQLVVRAIGFPTGVLYHWFPIPRYAFRELVFRRIVPGFVLPDAKVSGQDAMLYLQIAQTWKGNNP